MFKTERNIQPNQIQPSRRLPMIRKTILAIAATATLGLAALAPTAASAGWHGHHNHWGHGFGWGGYGIGYGLGLNYVDTGGCYVVKKLVATDFGMQVRRVTVCN
jgi:hypothetical protein